MALISSTTKAHGGREMIVGSGANMWKVHMFYSTENKISAERSAITTTTFTVHTALTSVEMLILGGGGGGGRAGGGGAGGLVVLQAGVGNYNSYPLAMSAGTYNVQVGRNGVAHNGDSASNRITAGDSHVQNGTGTMSNSGTIGVTIFQAQGGGVGGYSANAGAAGGCGGGGGFNSTTTAPASNQSGLNSGTNYTGFQFGSAGGAGSGGNGTNSGGGGGGTAGAGEAGSVSHIPSGGAGKVFNFRGFDEVFGTGGGGDGHSGSPQTYANESHSRIYRGGWFVANGNRPSQDSYKIGMPQAWGSGGAGSHSPTTSGYPTDYDMQGTGGCVFIRYKIA